MALANHPISGLYFTMTGGPEVFIKLLICFWELNSLTCIYSHKRMHQNHYLSRF